MELNSDRTLMNFASRNWINSYPWMATGIGLQLVLAALALAGMLFDKRQILGLNPWIKPLKFDLSVFIMLVTVAVFLGGLQRFSTIRLWAGESLAVSLTLENFQISFQALRGVRSHMNYKTPFDAHAFTGMGLMVAIATAAIALTLILLFVAQPPWPAAVTWGVRLGRCRAGPCLVNCVATTNTPTHNV